VAFIIVKTMNTLQERRLRAVIRQLIREEAEATKQVHVFDFDDTLGLTSNANAVMLYKDGKPVHKSAAEVKAWLKGYGVSDKDLLEPGIVPIKEREGAYAAYLTSSGLAKVQKNFPSDRQGVTTGFADKVEQEGETILIDFTPSSSTDVETTKPIKSTIGKLKKMNAQGAETAVVTARKATGTGTDIHGNPVEATNDKDMKAFLSKYGAEPNAGVYGVTGQNKGTAIINKFVKGKEPPPEEIHFYDDLKKNTDEVEAAIAGKVPVELDVYGPGEFEHGEADPNKPTKKFPAKKDKEDVKEEGLDLGRILELSGLSKASI
jgi:hypothetical protein